MYEMSPPFFELAFGIHWPSFLDTSMPTVKECKYIDGADSFASKPLCTGPTETGKSFAVFSMLPSGVLMVITISLKPRPFAVYFTKYTSSLIGGTLLSSFSHENSSIVEKTKIIFSSYCLFLKNLTLYLCLSNWRSMSDFVCGRNPENWVQKYKEILILPNDFPHLFNYRVMFGYFG